jgi:hypothetical protein
MTIIESQVTGKCNQQTCEDGIVVTDDFVAVIDGSTSKSPLQIDPSIKNGRFCMLLLSDFIRGMKRDTTCSAFCKEITRYIADVYGAHDIDRTRLQVHPTERLTASVIVYSKTRNEVWMVGDCQCIVDGRLHENPKPGEAQIAKERAAYIQELLKKGRRVSDLQLIDDGRKAILPKLIASCEMQNKEYAVVDGFPIPLDKVKIISVKDNSIPVVLASDGYPFLFDTLEKSEEQLQELLREDPLCIDKFKATKGLMMGNGSYDDRSYIRFLKD